MVNEITIEDKFNHLSDYLKYRTDIISGDYKKWLGVSKYQLPTFEYYLEKCVKNKGGNYDFTLRRFSSPSVQTDLRIFNQSVKKEIKIRLRYEYSMWMGTPFNFKEIIT
jgi:hypothetical protein